MTPKLGTKSGKSLQQPPSFSFFLVFNLLYQDALKWTPTEVFKWLMEEAFVDSNASVSFDNEMWEHINGKALSGLANDNESLTALVPEGKKGLLIALRGKIRTLFEM